MEKIGLKRCSVALWYNDNLDLYYRHTIKQLLRNKITTIIAKEYCLFNFEIIDGAHCLTKFNMIIPGRSKTDADKN